MTSNSCHAFLKSTGLIIHGLSTTGCGKRSNTIQAGNMQHLYSDFKNLKKYHKE